MDIHPTPDQEAFIRDAISTGRIQRPEDAAIEAMALWEERERRRIEILGRLDQAEASLAKGNGIAITQDSMDALAADVRRRGRARLELENASRS